MNNSPFSILVPLLPKEDIRYIKWRESLKKRPPPWNKGYTKITHPRIQKFSQTLKRNKIDNLAKWRAFYQKNRVTEAARSLLKDENLAFLIGLILGDGNIYRFPRTECLRIVLGTDKPELIELARRSIVNVFKKSPTIAKRKNSNCVNVTLYQNRLSFRLGIPSGARGYLKISIPGWIKKKKSFLISCLRGLFEAEGSFSIHQPTYTYNLSFSNTNTSLLDEVEIALNDLGFHPERRLKAVRLRKKAETFIFVELISFRKYNTP